MATYQITAPDGNKYRLTGPDNASEQDLINALLSQNPMAGQSTAELEAVKSAPMDLGDTLRSLGSGVVGGGKSIVDFFGTGTDISKGLGEAQSYLQEGLSPERKAEIARREELQNRAAESGSFLQEAKAFLGGVAEAPIQSLVQAAGSSVPAIVAGIAAIPAGAPTALALGVGTIAKLSVGAIQGVGEMKGGVFDAVKAEYMKQGKTEQEAEDLAIKSSEYSRETAFQTGGAALLGALDAATGAEPGVAKALRRASPTGELTKEAIEKGVAALPEKAISAPSYLGQFAKGVAGEAPLEGSQGAFGQYGENVALQQAGADVTPMQGVLGAGLRDAAVGALFGGAVSPATMQSAKREYATDQFLRQAKEDIELDKRAAESEKAKEQSKEGLGVKEKQLLLPAPAKKYEEPKDPLQDPVGRVTEDELGKAIGNNTVVSYLNKYRKENNLPKLKSYSIEDIKDAMTAQNPEGEEGALNSILAYKTGYKDETYTPEDINNVAVAKNVATETKGFSDFLTRATGKSDLNNMTQPELHSVAKALEALPRTGTEEQLVLPEGSNATRFTQDQYNQGVTTALMGVKQGKPVSLDQARNAVKAQTDLKTDRDADHMLRTAASNEDLIIERGTGFQATNKAGDVLGTYGTEAEAKRNHRRADIAPVETQLVRAPEEAKTEKVAKPPEGYAIEKTTEVGEERPAAYVLRKEGSQKNESQTFAEESDVKNHLELLSRKREATAASKDAEADRIRKQLEAQQGSIAQMEADGLTGTAEHTKAVNAFKAANVSKSDQITKLVEEAQVLRTPLKVVPLGKKSTKVEKHTVTKGGKKLGTFPSPEAAQNQILAQMTDEELDTAASDTRQGGFANRAKQEQYRRSKGDTGRGVSGESKEKIAKGLEAAGVHTPEVEAQLAELKAKLLPMLKKFGLEEVGLNVVRAIENDADGAWGKADKLIRIALQATKPIQTMRHEALHALKELGFFTPQQWEALKRQAEKSWVNTYLKGEMVEVNGKKMTRYDAYANGVKNDDGSWALKPLSPEDILEEAIADAFGSWEGGAKPPPGLMAALFKRLQQFFAALRQALTGAGFESAEDIFGKIERGELKAGKKADKETSEDQKFSARAAAYWMDAGKVVRGVTNEMDLTEEEFESTSLMHQTGKAGTEQFKPNKIGGLPEVVQFLQDQRRKSGLPLLDTEKPADRKIIARLMATEAMAAIRSGGANLEWYDSVINKTLAMAGLKYPELNTDINARMAFKIATAITSQGLNVEDNLAFAMKVYDQFRQSGKFPEIGQGADQGAMASNFKLANYLMDDMGADMMRQFLETEFTVEEMRGAGFNISGELGDEKVLGSSVFGPKIGFGFYSNLNGNFDPVTMDMWFMRTIGRLTGKLKSFRQDLYDAQLEKFRDELTTEGSNGVFANQFDQNEVELAKVDDKAAEALARKVKSAHERDYKTNRASFDDKTREKSKLVAVSETMIKSLDAPKDAPANGSERRNLRDIVRQMVDIVEEKYGKRVPPASLQAVIWYPEQELYKSMGVKLRVTSQNYAGAIEKILTGEGYGESNLSAAAKLGSRTAQQLAKSAVTKGSKATGTQPVRLGALQAEEKEALLERGRKRIVLEEEKETPKRKRVIFEVAPDPNNKALTDKWRSLSNELRIKISEKIGNTIIKSALTEFGLKGYVDTQVGSYLDDTNPSFALYLDSGDSVAMAKFLGYVLSQDSMMVVSPKAGKGLDQTGAVRVNIGDVPASKVDKIYQQLREIEVDGEKPVGGQSYMNGHMVVLNYSNVPTDQLAKLINDKLDDNYEVITEDVYTAFPEKKDYDYANPSSDPRGNAGVLRQAGRDLRTEATRLLQKELKNFRPEAPAKDQKLSLRQVRDIFDRAEEISEPPGVESIRQQWIGGVSGIGDRDSMYDLYRVSGSKKYIQDVQDFVRKELGDDFKGYRLMSNDELEELETGAMGSQYVSFTLNPDVARAFKNIPAYAEKTGMSVVEMDLTPEHVAMIGHPGELELVVDYGQGYNPSDVKVVEKYSLKTYFPTAEAAENAAYKKAPPGTAEFKRFFGGSTVKEEGRPQVMYHASTNVFDEFRENKPIFISPDPKWAEQFGKARAVTEEKKDVMVYPLWVRAETPFDFDNYDHTSQLVDRLQKDSVTKDGRIELKHSELMGTKTVTPEDYLKKLRQGDWTYIENDSAQEALKALGFDSFYVKEDGAKNLAVFNANQVKSVTGNIGDFSENKSIKFSLKPVPADIDAAIDRTTTARDDKGFIGRILEAIFPQSAGHFRQQALNRYNQLGVYDRMLADKMGGAAMLADASAESAALMSDLSASVTASAFGYGNRTGGVPVYKNGITTIDTSVKGPIAILAPLAKYNNPRIYQRYQFWAGVKRGKRFMNVTMPDGTVVNKEKNFEQADIARAAQLERDHPEFVQVQKEMNEFNNGLVKYMVQTGVIKPELAKVYMEHADYIPFYRQMDGERTVGPNIFQSISGVKPPKALKFGDAPLADYLETIVRNTQSAIQSGMKNVASQRAVGVAEKIGMAQRLNTQDSAPDTVQVMENGVRVSYRVQDPLFIDACRSLNLPDLPFMGILAAPANLLRNLVTKDPGFMLANLMRDSLSSWVTSGTSVKPIIGTVAGFTKALSAKSASMEALLNAGILGGYEFSSGVLRSGEVLEADMNKKYGKATGAKVLLKPFTSLWDALEKGTEASDAATRIAIYERVLADTGNEAEAIFRSLEVMNFNRKGSSAVIRIATAAIPFLNARMQGLDIFYRASFGRDTVADPAAKQRAFFVRGATLMALSIAMYIMVSDDDEYKKQEEETKDNYWIVPGVGKFPTPFEVGFLFKTVPERIYAAMFKDDTGQDLKESMKRGIISTLAFNPVPQTFKPLAEALVNYNSFTGRVIVGAGMEGRAPEFQVGPSTSEVAKQLGSALGLSPLKVDHVLQGYTGTIGMYLVQATDSVLSANDNSPNASKRFEQLPIIKRFAVDPEARGNITQFYALKNATDQAVTTLNFLERSGDAEAYAKYFEDNAGILANKNYVNSIEKQMKKYREMRSMVQSAEMTGDEKRDLLIDIGRAENALNENIKEVKKMIKEVQ